MLKTLIEVFLYAEGSTLLQVQLNPVLGVTSQTPDSIDEHESKLGEGKTTEFTMDISKVNFEDSSGLVQCRFSLTTKFAVLAAI